MIPIRPLSECGIIPSPYDMRDLKFTTAKFGAPNPATLPREGLGRVPISIEDQEATNFCTAGVSNASEYQEGVPLSWDFQVAAISRLKGEQIFGGCDPRTALQSPCAYGSLEEAESFYKLATHGAAFISNWQVWSPAQWESAKKHRKASFLWVRDGNDKFDNIRSALALGKEEGQVVMAFGRWYENWNYVDTDGMIPPPQGRYTLHFFIFYDWGVVNGREVLKAQLSSGKKFGDGGTVYFERDTINQVWADVHYSSDGIALAMFKDASETDIERMKEERLSLMEILAEIIKRLLARV